MPLLLNAMQKLAAENRSACCLVVGQAGTGKTALLTEKARLLHEESGVSYSDMAVIFQSERDASIARSAILNSNSKDKNHVKPQDLRFFGTFLSVSYELLRQNLSLPCLDWFHSGFTVMDAEQEYDIAMRLLTDKNYGIFKNNIRLKVSKALRGEFVGSTAENAGLAKLHEDLRNYLKENRIIIRDKLPDWALFIASQADAFLPKILMVDNIHRVFESENNALLALCKRAQEITFTIDDSFKYYRCSWGGEDEFDGLNTIDSESDRNNELVYNEADLGTNTSCQINDDVNRDDVSEKQLQKQLLNHPTYKFLQQNLNNKGIEIVQLEHNYRKSQLPLGAALRLAGNSTQNNDGLMSSGNISLSSFADSREAAMSIATSIEELSLRGAQYSEIGILYADGFMQKTLVQVFRERGIPFENGLGDYVGASTAASWLLKVLRFSLSPINCASGADAVYDRQFGDSGLRRGDTRSDRIGVERIPSRSELFQKMRWFVSNLIEAEKNAGEKGLNAKWIVGYFDIEPRIKRGGKNYNLHIRSVKSIIDTIEALRAQGKRTLIQAIAQFLCNYNVRGRYALIKPCFPNSVRIAHYKVETPYNFPFLFITDCNEGKISSIDGDDIEEIVDKAAFYTAIRRCSFELNLSFMRVRTAKNGVVHDVYPSPLLRELVQTDITASDETMQLLSNGRGSIYPEESLISYEDFMAGFDSEQLALIKGTKNITLLNAPVGTGKTKLLVGRILYLNREYGISFRKMLVCCYSKRAIAEVMATILHIKGFNNLNPVLDFPLFGTFESLCIKLLNKRLRISEYGYGRGFRIQKEEQEFYHAMQIARELKAWTSQEELENTVKAWINASYPEVYKNVGTDIQALCGEDVFVADDSNIQVDVTDPVFVEFVNRLVHYKRDNNLMCMRDARFMATALISALKKRVSDVLIDEFQEFDALQLEFVNRLCLCGARLFAVGDAQQVIYEWHHEGDFSFNCLAHKYQVPVDTLTNNYRNADICRVAHGILNEEQSEFPSEASNALEQFKVLSFSENVEAAKYLVARILELRQQDVPYEDMAIFFRTPQSTQRVLTTIFGRLDIPVNLWTSHSGHSVSGHSFNNMNTAPDNCNVDDEARGISILSLHRSKGLEYPYVFIIDATTIGCDALDNKAKSNERALYYVGMTRASTSLELLYVRNSGSAELENAFLAFNVVKENSPELPKIFDVDELEDACEGLVAQEHYVDSWPELATSEEELIDN